MRTTAMSLQILLGKLENILSTDTPDRDAIKNAITTLREQKRTIWELECVDVVARVHRQHCLAKQLT